MKGLIVYQKNQGKTVNDKKMYEEALK